MPEEIKKETIDNETAETKAEEIEIEGADEGKYFRSRKYRKRGSLQKNTAKAETSDEGGRRC